MADLKTYQFRAGGRWCAPERSTWIDSEDPAEGKVWARIPDCGAGDIDKAVSAAQTVFASGAWSGLTAAQRGRR